MLPEEWLRDWTANLTTILSYLKVRKFTLPPGRKSLIFCGVLCSGDSAEITDLYCI